MEEYIKQYKELVGKIAEIGKEGSKLQDLKLDDVNASLLDASTNDINDWQGISLLVPKIYHLLSLVIDIGPLKLAVNDMENGKDKFELQKLLKDMKETRQHTIRSFLDGAKFRKFDDYRCIDWQKRVVDIFLEAKSFFDTNL